MLRRCSEAEVRSEPRSRRREKEVFRIARHFASALDLPIKIVRADAEVSGKTIVYFASEERVDFRELFRRISAAAQGRVELRQIGVRDACKLMGGLGPCGEGLCCTRFLREFAPISIKMAKDQGLVLNPVRVSGLCGRLLCCLTYEDELYRSQRKLLPKLGKRVVTPKGPGRVRDVDVLSQVIRVILESGDIAAFKPEDIAPMFPSQATGQHSQRTRSRETQEDDDDEPPADAAVSRDEGFRASEPLDTPIPPSAARLDEQPRAEPAELTPRSAADHSDGESEPDSE